MGITRTNICETQFIIPQVKSLIHLFDTRHLMPEEDLEKMRLNTPEMQKLERLSGSGGSMQDESNASFKIRKPLTALGTRSEEGIPASPFVLHHPHGVGKGKAGGRGGGGGGGVLNC